MTSRSMDPRGPVLVLALAWALTPAIAQPPAAGGSPRPAATPAAQSGASSAPAKTPPMAPIARDDTQGCLVCHNNEHLVVRESKGGVRSMFVDPAPYFESVHGKLECTYCHGKIGAGPHEEPSTDIKTGLDSCLNCHKEPRFAGYHFSDIAKEFKDSVHAKAMPDTFNCFSCHDPHRFEGSRAKMTVQETIKRDNAICRGCHESPEQFALWTDKPMPDPEQVHEWLPNAPLHWQHVRCVECHTPHTPRFSHEILGADRAEQRCEACHNPNDSILLTKLYRHQVSQRGDRYGFINGVVFNDAYVIGMTRNVWIERISLAMVVAMVLVLAAHGVGRWLAHRARQRPTRTS